MRARWVVALLVAVLAVYFWLITRTSLSMIGSGRPVAIGLGIGILLLPLVGAVLVGFELRFGFRTQHLARRLLDEDAMPEEPQLPLRPSGRVDREAADAYFETVRGEVEGEPGEWRGWYKLAVAYNLAGDRKRAREAMRQAIRLEGDAAGSAR
jgi:tetratricopeptide (TPR) repeat protein